MGVVVILNHAPFTKFHDAQIVISRRNLIGQNFFKRHSAREKETRPGQSSHVAGRRLPRVRIGPGAHDRIARPASRTQSPRQSGNRGNRRGGAQGRVGGA